VFQPSRFRERAAARNKPRNLRLRKTRQRRRNPLKTLLPPIILHQRKNPNSSSKRRLPILLNLNSLMTILPPLTLLR
jgi:hypothetical protein